MKKEFPLSHYRDSSPERRAFCLKKASPFRRGGCEAEVEFGLVFCFKVVDLTREKYINKGILSSNFDKTKLRKKG
jgi:hypothetical protein